MSSACGTIRENSAECGKGPRSTDAGAAGRGRALLAADFGRLHTLVFRYLVHRFFDPELAEELAAQTFYKAVAATDRFGDTAPQLQAWLLRTASNVANTHYRRTRRRNLLLGRFLWQRRPEAAQADADDSHPLRDRVRAVLQTLRPQHQSVVVLRYYLHMSYAEIAGVLGCGEVAARARVSRAVRTLRERLNR